MGDRVQQDDGAAIRTLIGGAYRVTGGLGAGAMGEVYRAEEVERGTPVAIKVLAGTWAPATRRIVVP
jgi:hypothetical protein